VVANEGFEQGCGLRRQVWVGVGAEDGRPRAGESRGKQTGIADLKSQLPDNGECLVVGQ